MSGILCQIPEMKMKDAGWVWQGRRRRGLNTGGFLLVDSFDVLGIRIEENTEKITFGKCDARGKRSLANPFSHLRAADESRDVISNRVCE